MPQVNALRGGIYSLLRRRFKERVHRNDTHLRAAWINRHSWDHMDTVANGVYHLGIRMRAAWEDVLAVTLATRFHDIGYDFPEGIDPESCTKEQHCQHAQRGADFFADAIVDTRKKRGFDDVMPWWTERHTQLGHDAIRLHSNGSTLVAPEVRGRADMALALLPRLLDKLHNSADRIYPEHLDLFSRVPHKTIGHIRQRVQQGTRWLLEAPSLQARHRNTPDEAFEKLELFEYGFAHRLVPHAITDQRLLMHPDTGMLEVEYMAYPSRVEGLLGVPYDPEMHSAHFDLAYDRSMQNAACVAAMVRRRLFGEHAAEMRTPPLRVRLAYDDGSVVTKDYGAHEEAPVAQSRQQAVTTV